MAAPSQQAISVAIGAVRGAANSWDEAAAALEAARVATEGTKFEQLEFDDATVLDGTNKWSVNTDWVTH